MTQKERLVEDVKLQIFAALGNVNCDTCVYKDYDAEPCRLCHIKYNQWAISKDTLQNLAEGIVKRAIKNGVIVPPCKVGDDVFYVVRDRVLESVVRDVYYDGTRYIFNRANCYLRAFYDHEIDRTVFLTREEAEQALKERETE